MVLFFCGFFFFEENSSSSSSSIIFVLLLDELGFFWVNGLIGLISLLIIFGLGLASLWEIRFVFFFNKFLSFSFSLSLFFIFVLILFILLVFLLSEFIFCVLDVFDDWGGFDTLFLSLCFSLIFSLSFSFSSNGIHIFELLLFVSFSFSFSFFVVVGFLNSIFSSLISTLFSSSIIIFSSASFKEFFLLQVSPFLSESSSLFPIKSSISSFCSFIFVVSNISNSWGSFIPLWKFLKSKLILLFNLSSTSPFISLFLSLSSLSNDNSLKFIFSLSFSSLFSSLTASFSSIFSCSLLTFFSSFSLLANILLRSLPPILLFSISNKVNSFLGEFCSLSEFCSILFKWFFPCRVLYFFLSYNSETTENLFFSFCFCSDDLSVMLWFEFGTLFWGFLWDILIFFLLI